jgi:translation initiation factor IF-2
MAKSKPIGKVTHWYDKIGVAVVKLSGALKAGDKIKVKRGETEFEDTVSSLQFDHADIKAGKKGQEVAVKLSSQAKEGSEIYIAE